MFISKHYCHANKYKTTILHTVLSGCEEDINYKCLEKRCSGKYSDPKARLSSMNKFKTSKLSIWEKAPENGKESSNSAHANGMK